MNDEARGCICQNQHRHGYCTEPGCPHAEVVRDQAARIAKEPNPALRSDHIRRAERKEEEARHLLREAAYLRDLEKRLKGANKVSDIPTDNSLTSPETMGGDRE